jgi:RNA polymerase sigma-70 factor (ECF subfamily)
MSAAPSIPESTATLEAAQAALLYERYSSKILGYCRRRLPSREEAEDAVQHTFLNAYRSLRTGVVPHAEAAWLYKIAENVCHEHRRSAWRRSRIEAVSDDGELRDAVAVAQIDERQAAKVPPAMDPARERDVGPCRGSGQLATGVRAMHESPF